MHDTIYTWKAKSIHYLKQTREHYSPVKGIAEYSCTAESGSVEKEQMLKSQQA
jgi:hypothetical protein